MSQELFIYFTAEEFLQTALDFLVLNMSFLKWYSNIQEGIMTGTLLALCNDEYSSTMLDQFNTKTYANKFVNAKKDKDGAEMLKNRAKIPPGYYSIIAQLDAIHV